MEWSLFHIHPPPRPDHHAVSIQCSQRKVHASSAIIRSTSALKDLAVRRRLGSCPPGGAPQEWTTAQPWGHRGDSEGTLAMGRALHCAHTAGPLRNVNNGDERRERDHKEPRSHNTAAKRDRGPRGAGGACRAIPRQHEPPRLWDPENRAGGGKSFSPPPALCSGPTRSRLSYSAARAILSLLARKGAQAGQPGRSATGAAWTGAILWQSFQGHRRRPPRSLPSAPPTARSRAAAALRPSGGAAWPHCPCRPRRIRPSFGGEQGASLRSHPEEPARRRASIPSRRAGGPHFLCAARPPPLAFICGSHTAPGRRTEPRRPLPTLRCVGPGRPSPARAPSQPEASLRPAGRTAARTAAPGRGRLPRPERGLGGRGCSRRLRAARAAGLLALQSENGVQTTLGGAQGQPGWAPLRSAANS